MDTIELTHEQVAERLGVYRETVTTALSTLRKDGLISIARRQIQLRMCLIWRNELSDTVVHQVTKSPPATAKSKIDAKRIEV